MEEPSLPLNWPSGRYWGEIKGDCDSAIKYWNQTSCEAVGATWNAGAYVMVTNIKTNATDQTTVYRTNLPNMNGKHFMPLCVVPA